MATGAGPVLQPGGDPVEGYSNPAWLALLVLGRLTGLFDRGTWFGLPDYVAFPKLLGLLCVVGAFAAMYSVARTLTRHPVAVTVAAGALTAAVPSFVIWSFSGMENPLFAATVLALAAVLARATTAGALHAPAVAVGCGLLAATAALTRPDGLIYVLAYPLVVLLFADRGALGRTVRAVVIAGAAFAVPFGSYVGWRLATFGELLPNTAVAKAQGTPTAADLARPATLLGYAGWLATVVAVLVVGAALMRPSAQRNGLIAVLVPLGLAVAAFGVLPTDWMAEHRFATPVWPLGTLASVVALAHIGPRLAVRGRVALAATAAAAVALSGTNWATAAEAFRASPTVPMCHVADNSGREFNTYAELLGVADGTLLTPDVGGSALTSRLRIVDLAGLADARIARFWNTGDVAGLRDHVYLEVKPTFLHSHEGWSSATGILEDPRLAADYVWLHRSATHGESWVRRDAVRDGAGLAAARRWAARNLADVDARHTAAPRASCGAVLRTS